MCVLRGGEEEQTPGVSVSRLRPWRQGLAAEVATNADVQTAPRAHAHAPGETSRARQERKKQTEESFGVSLGKEERSRAGAATVLQRSVIRTCLRALIKTVRR